MQPLKWAPAIACALLLLLLAGPLRAEEPGSAWLDTGGRPSASAREALQLLADADSDGLAPGDYRAAELAATAAALAVATESAASQQAAFARELEAALLRFMRDLHFGRIDPRTLGMRLPPRTGGAFDMAQRLHAALAERRLSAVIAGLRPRFAQYGKLREALAHYRTLAQDPALSGVLAGRPSKAGDRPPFPSGLAPLLSALGDLPAGTAPRDVDEAAVAAGLRRFQRRHGLADDAVAGAATLAALNTRLAQRVQQIELALERLRWLPDMTSSRFVAINIPMFRLWAWDPAAPERPPLGMPIVVGRALDTQTPVLAQEMRYLVFRPYWNVPRSILSREILPALAHDPRYLERNDMEIVRGAGDDARPVQASADNLQLLRRGVLRVRQRPGPRNSLGLVKFIFPNDDNVYLHGTPATSLFGRTRRDFSHGCVRVADPVALAQWVLDDPSHWTRDRVRAAMEGSEQSRRVDLARPLQVILFYTTTMVDPQDGSLHFAADIYGHDAALQRALVRSRAGSP